MKLNKEEFLNTELGRNLVNCIIDWDETIEASKNCWNPEALCTTHQVQWERYKKILKELYGIDYYFARAAKYFGVVTEDETNWLFKIERKEENDYKVGLQEPNKYIEPQMIKKVNADLRHMGWGEGERKSICALLEQHID